MPKLVKCISQVAKILVRVEHSLEIKKEKDFVNI